MGTEPRRILAAIGTWSGRVRVRITLVAVVIVSVALVISATVLVSTLGDLLADNVADSARLRSLEIAGEAAAGSLPAVLPTDDPDSEAIQVLDAGNRVIIATDNVAGLPPIARPAAGESVEVDAPNWDSPVVVVATPAAGPTGTVTAIVALSLDSVTESTELVAELLAVGLPGLLIVIGTVTWILVGRSLGPVEAIRNEVDEISSRELHRRVPEPAAEDEIGRLARTMNRMLERIENGHRRQRQFVSDASHELRTPVAVIREHAEIVLAHPGEIAAPELARTVLAENLRIQRLIEDLLLLARSDERGLQLQRSPVDLDDIVLDVAGWLRQTTELRIDTAGLSAGQIVGDEQALSRVLHNLAENAARHARSHIAFTLVEVDGQVDLTVDDDGPGIPPEARDRVLERFVRLDPGRGREFGGSGLGLSIVAEIVREHGGDMEIAASPAGGARVRLRFPAVPEPD